MKNFLIIAIMLGLGGCLSPEAVATNKAKCESFGLKPETDGFNACVAELGEKMLADADKRFQEKLKSPQAMQGLYIAGGMPVADAIRSANEPGYYDKYQEKERQERLIRALERPRSSYTCMPFGNGFQCN